MAWSVYRARLRFLPQQTLSEYTQRGVNETEQALQEHRDFLNTAEGRRQMSTVRGDTYGNVSRFRDGGTHYDYGDENDSDDDNGWFLLNTFSMRTWTLFIVSCCLLSIWWMTL